MIHVAVPYVVAAALVGAGLYGTLSRRHPMLLVIGIQLVLSGAVLLLVTASATGPDPARAGEVMAALVPVIGALLVVLVAGAALATWAVRGRVDLTDEGPDGSPLARPVDDTTAPEPVLPDDPREVTG